MGSTEPNRWEPLVPRQPVATMSAKFSFYNCAVDSSNYATPGVFDSIARQCGIR